MRKRIGILGGSFDPLHNGHLGVAREVQQRLQLDEMRLLPCYLSPHKIESSASADHRVELIRACLANEPSLSLDLREAHSERQVFSVDTLTDMRQELGEQASIVFVIGWDSWLALPTWHRWRALFELCNLALVPRPGFNGAFPEAFKGEIEQRELVVERLCDYSAGHYAVLDTKLWDLSSTELRDKLARGEDVQDMLPAPGLQYIQEHHLYQ